MTPSNVQPHTDYINPSVYVLLFMFTLSKLEAKYESPSDAVSEYLGKALHDLKVRPNKRLRERTFTIWVGEYESPFDEAYYLVGIQMPLPDEIPPIFEKQFRCVAGYQQMDTSMTDAVGIVPLARYDKEDLIEYVTLPTGIVTIDDYFLNSGLRTYQRVALSSTLIGREYYGPLDRDAVPVSMANLQAATPAPVTPPPPTSVTLPVVEPESVIDPNPPAIGKSGQGQFDL